ncbi:MAG: peptidase M24 [Coprobacter sp.]|jgi:putative peptidase M23/M37 family|uniref:murein hydrolase activator EnvC family protein n=1 Tax=Barnesiella propionica TaxID=2981781 RepID=UPI000D79B5A1|nr:peptidoglycan DD-metalloendopeptidase family protein [Barnesiella propionica]MBO1734913.1 peptidoglycan DD-metalloendopeptidase family protein [Barnesiella sp. GGCC_0306]MBS7039319.1 peptidoglycan DD-metalloendopeptidase family protein [Bacteroidales bacterium]MCU6769552.1 peptidoglycan DD-metalloendopeptidase family protein [Barnesiella propionica]PWM89705.1 MAG: peptidase M24 [Coprobacter sp.]
MKRLLAIFLFTVIPLLAFSDVPSMKDLKQQQREALKAIEETSKKLASTKKNARNSLYELNAITSEIKTQRGIIETLNKEISMVNRRNRAVSDTIYLLQKELNAKKASYAKAVRGMGHRHSEYDELMFIFSASSLSQSYRRVRYLKEYSAWRKRQASEIISRQEELKVQKAKLERIIAEKKALLGERNVEAEKLKKKENSKRSIVADLKKQEKSLQRDLKKRQQQADALNRKLEQLIAEEERKAAERAAKLAQKESTGKKGSEAASKPKSTGGYKMTKEEQALSGSFEKNKGRLPFPLSGSYRIVGHFGMQQHPELKYVKINNNGIEIQTTPGNVAKTVFGGVVSRVFVTPGYNTSVIVRHGNYLTIYANLSEVYVKAGDKLSARQSVGKIYSDPEEGNRTILHFQIWKERTKLDPEQWIN